MSCRTTHPSGLQCRLFERPAACTDTRIDTLFLPDGSADWEQARRRSSAAQSSGCSQTCGSESRDHFVGRRIRVKLTPAYCLCKIIQSSFAVQLELRAQSGEGDALHLMPSTDDPPFLAPSGLRLCCPETVDGFQQIVNTAMLVRDRHDDRRLPVL